MTYRYWYVPKEAPRLVFAEAQTDLMELGPLPFTNEQALKKIELEADKLGRKVVKVREVRGY